MSRRIASPAALAAALLLLVAAAAPGGWQAERAAMVARIRAHILADRPAAAAPLAPVLAAAAAVDRRAFLPRAARAAAYGDAPVPIGHGQTATDAYAVVLMISAASLPAHARVLEIGTGSGYEAALLARLAERVDTIEILPSLARSAARRLRRLGYANVAVHQGDGYAGWPPGAPYDAIIVAAGSDRVPPPLVEQLKPGGVLVMPLGAQWAFEQLLVLRKRADGSIRRCSLGAALFVPLTGRGARPATATGLFDRSLTDCG